MKNNKVIITANKNNGQIFTPSLNADGSPKLDKNGNPTGYIRVENPSEIDLAYSYNGGVKRGQSALMPMSVAGWEKVKDLKDAEGKVLYRDGATAKGNVVILETTEAGKPGYKAKMAGSGTDAQPCLLGGAQIYRTTVFDATCKLEDELIQHDNVIVGSTAKADVKSDSIN